MRKIFLLIASHGVVGIIGFAIGIYALPILIAPPAPSESDIVAMSSDAQFTAEFSKSLKGSDAFHWGEGRVSINRDFITLMGSLAPGPDYKLYLSPEFVETEAEVERIKSSMALVGDVKTFENFAVALKPDIDPNNFNTVLVWCESFGEFITSAKYR